MDYALLREQVAGLIADEKNAIANLANVAAVLFNALEDVNWAGFYLVDTTKPEELVLGPFQGQPACVRIPFNKGVCGAAASTLTSQLVADVHAFPGHIACDAASNSEVVIPIVCEGRLYGVLDIDSPSLNRFNDTDLAGLEAIVATLETQL
ncbi:GAF domain-containing protein [Opacimonas viscosa]|uniref:GAF domain-containing protein n=1 Tax=Opacimonas viscosa TaxID=2961944 RepID=A0AA42BKA5_9ALTE|nr:GAF domain-containing protein [Opacimonas viscosa]MCP3427525.1 GAF domain-containing protein [Opacimonas viscosa]